MDMTLTDEERTELIDDIAAALTANPEFVTDVMLRVTEQTLDRIQVPASAERHAVNGDRSARPLLSWLNEKGILKDDYGDWHEDQLDELYADFERGD